LALLAAFLILLQRSRRDFDANESLASLQDSARHALGVLAADIEHAGFFGLSGARHIQLMRGGAVLAEREALSQPVGASATAAVSGLPAGAHDCGINFAVDLATVVQGSDNRYAIGHGARNCEPTASAGGASALADTLTLRHASQTTTAPRAGRVQLYSTALAAYAPLTLFADGRAPGPIDDEHEVRDLEVRTWYVANNSVDRPGWPALRVKSLTESRGAAQFRDEEIMPGVEDLQVEFLVARRVDGERQLRLLSPEDTRTAGDQVIAVKLWLRIRADHTESGFRDDRPLHYAGNQFSPGADARHRRIVVQRTVALRNAGP
jgi:hypothetical protein